MFCDNCKINSATVFWKQSVNDEIVTLNLCDSCAGKLSIDLYFSKLFEEFLEEIEKINFFSKLNENLEIKKCNTCGNTLEKMKKTGQLGCSECYLTFKEELKSIINKIQSSYEHVGKIPQRSTSKIKLKREVKNLREKLKNAINQENYELAAELRDKIKEIERGDLDGKMV